MNPLATNTPANYSSAIGSPAGLLNLRDVATTTGVAPGVLLRSDAPLGSEPVIDRSGTISVWPPATVIDLRSRGERVGPHPLDAVSTVRWLPLLDDLAPGQFNIPDTLAEMYISLLKRPLARRLVEAVELIATSPSPVLVHCTAGKDRTGVVVAVALAIAGVDRELIVADYAATAAAMPHLLARWRAQPAAVPVSDVPTHLTEARPSTMKAFLDQLDHAGPQRWFADHGGGTSAPDRLVARLAAPT